MPGLNQFGVDGDAFASQQTHRTLFAVVVFGENASLTGEAYVFTEESAATQKTDDLKTKGAKAFAGPLVITDAPIFDPTAVPGQPET